MFDLQQIVSGYNKNFLSINYMSATFTIVNDQ
jgi:hypothetical protein